MSHWGGDHRGRAMAWGLNQHLVTAGLGLNVVGRIERDPNLTAVVVPTYVVGAPVKGCDIHSTIVLNQLLFRKVVSIVLGVAKFIT